MLFVPGKFAFVHIPRTGGNSITRTLVKNLIDREDLVCSTCHTRILWRHMPASKLVEALPFAKTTPIFAVERDMESIIQSDFNLWKIIPRSYENGDRDFSIKLAAAENLESFRKYWLRFLGGMTPTQYWTQGTRVTLLPFDDMEYTWQELCQVAGLENVPLEKFDFQKDWFERWTQNIAQ